MGRDDPTVSAYEVGYWTRPSPWSPNSWSRKVWVWIGTGIVVVVAAVVGAVVGVRLAKDGSGSYPNYSRLNYTLIDTCELVEGVEFRCVEAPWERGMLRGN